VSAGEAWSAVYLQAVPLAAASLRDSTGDYPSLELGTATHNARFEDLDDVQPPPALFANVTDVVAAALDVGAGALPAPVPLRVADHDYPAFPPHDLRAAHRVCVALGAALGAAGLAGHVRAVDVLTPTRAEAPSIRHPWSVERVVDPPDAPERTPLSWWRRLLQTVRSWFRRSLR
jgi:hypothetical protein